MNSVLNNLKTKMSLKFAANLSFMFQENSNFVERYQAAKSAGFIAVESAFPVDIPLEKIVEAKNNANVECVLLNIHPGDKAFGGYGLAALSSKQTEFQESLELTIKYAKGLQCKRIHIMSGVTSKYFTDASMEEVYLDNLKEAAERLYQEEMIGLIEPINNFSVPQYFMNNVFTAVNYLKKLNQPNLKLQLDLFHLQLLHGNLTNNIKDFLPYVGHIQIAQVPHRNEPNTDGEINYKYIFKLLQDIGYSDWIGLEYKPKGATIDGLNWMKEWNLL